MRTNRRQLALAVAGTGLAAAVITGCSTSTAPAAPRSVATHTGTTHTGTSRTGTAHPGAAGSTCGTARTAANVPVVIKVAQGTVDCRTALSVENDYASLLKHGQIRGNGGGAPVTVHGWTCQGYPTPEVLKTGDASECRTASAKVVAVIQLSSTDAGLRVRSCSPAASAPGGPGPR